MPLNIYEILFTIINIIILALLVLFIYKVFIKPKYSKKEMIKRLKELEEELSKIRDQEKDK